jgi:hypothetical protein
VPSPGVRPDSPVQSPRLPGEKKVGSLPAIKAKVDRLFTNETREASAPSENDPLLAFTCEEGATGSTIRAQLASLVIVEPSPRPSPGPSSTLSPADTETAAASAGSPLDQAAQSRVGLTRQVAQVVQQGAARASTQARQAVTGASALGRRIHGQASPAVSRLYGQTALTARRYAGLTVNGLGTSLTFAARQGRAWYGAVGERAARLDTRTPMLAIVRTSWRPRPEVVPHLLATSLVGAVALVILLFVLMPTPVVPPTSVQSVDMPSGPPSSSRVALTTTAESTVPPAREVAAIPDVPAPPPSVAAEQVRETATAPPPDLKRAATASPPARRQVARPVARAAGTATTGTRDRRQTDASVPPSPAGFRGSLSVSSSPQGAQVFVNGVSVGVTPLLLQDQAVGSRVVRVELVGHERWSSAVRIVANQRTSAVAQLRRSTVR